MAEQTGLSYPMISEKNWWTIRSKFKASLPTVVSPNYIKTLLTLSSDASAISNVISPMKRLGLIDDENKPTALANDWRLDDKYASACSSIVTKVYSSELLDLFPDSDIDRSSARNWFMSQGVGQGAADKMVALFVLLKSGEIKEAKTSTPRKAKQPVKVAEKQMKSQVADDETATTVNNPSIPQNAQVSNRPNLHIDLQIHISPDSSPEQIEAVFASMGKHLYGACN